MSEVYVNSRFVGTVDNSLEFVNQVKEERRKGNLTDNLNIYWNEAAGTIEIDSQRGRARRPLIVVKDGIPLLTEEHIKKLEKDVVNQFHKLYYTFKY